MFSRKLVLGVAAGVLVVVAATWTTLRAFDPQPDPPAFGVVSITPDQTIRLNAVCSEHGVGSVPPAPCRAELMLHDAAGNVLASQVVRLKPGQATFLDYRIGIRTAPFERVGIVPCVIPDPQRGRMLATAEIFDNTTGQTAFRQPGDPAAVVHHWPGRRRTVTATAVTQAWVTGVTESCSHFVFGQTARLDGGHDDALASDRVLRLPGRS